MEWLMFPDNTVLVNFGHMGLIPTFGDLVRGRGRWTATVAEESAMSSKVEGLEGLGQVASMLGEPLRLESTKEMLDTDSIRIALSRPGDGRYKNLGEAETLAIITNRFPDSGVFVTDDGPARLRANDLQVRTYTTFSLVVLAVRAGKLEREAGWNAVVGLRRIPRQLPGCPTTYFEFQKLCESHAAA